METILTVAVIVFIALMIFIGQHRGMIKMIFSLASMLIVLILVQILTPITKDFIETTPVYDAISKQVTQYVDEKIVDVSDSISQTGETAQKNTINSLPLPKSVKESLIKNNNADGYGRDEQTVWERVNAADRIRGERAKACHRSCNTEPQEA